MFIEELSLKWNVKAFTKRFETEKLAADEGISIQMAARNQRYEWFERIMLQNNFSKISTAHHKNDHIETILFNLTRGTGLTGLQGIPVQRENIIRPLLFATKQQIIDYANSEGLIWREDQSNEDSKYKRNFIRNDIIPRLKTINPNLEVSLSRTATYLSQVGEVFEDEMTKIANATLQVSGDDITIDLDKYKAAKQDGRFSLFPIIEI